MSVFQLVGFLVSLALFINALLFVPQLILLYKEKEANELSFATFFGFNLIQLIMLMQGYYRNDMILVYGMFASLISCGGISLLILYYRLFRKKLLQ